MPVDCRRQIVKRALKYARQQQSAKKKISDTLGSALCIALSLVLARLSMPFLMITCLVVHILQAFSNAIRFCSTHVESKGMRVNMNKTKVMISGKRLYVRTVKHVS